MPSGPRMSKPSVDQRAILAEPAGPASMKQPSAFEPIEKSHCGIDDGSRSPGSKKSRLATAVLVAICPEPNGVSNNTGNTPSLEITEHRDPPDVGCDVNVS